MPKANFTGGATGAISGASAGFTVGGPVGAAIGGTIGGVAGLFGNKKKKRKKLSTLDPMQQRLNEQQHQSILGEGPLADLYNYNPEAANAVFDQNIANPAYRQFKEQLAPTITGQFRNQGLMNSSYAGDALSKLARDIQENLNGKRAAYLYGEQSQAREAKRGAIENLLNRPTFGYDTQLQGGGFDINQVLGSIPSGALDQLAGMFNPKGQAAPTSSPSI